MIENGYEPNKKEIEQAVYLTEHWVNRRTEGKALDLQELLEELDVSLEYVSTISYPDRDVAAVVSWNKYIEIEKGEIDLIEPFQECWFHVSYLSHELMHIIAEKYMGVSNNDNTNHNVPYLLGPEWCHPLKFDEGPECDNNVEADVISSASDFCYEQKYGYPRYEETY